MHILTTSGSCTVGAGQGEPTVHVPVQLLTGESHSTITIDGAYQAAGAVSSTAVSTPATHNNVPGRTSSTSSANQDQPSSGAGTDKEQPSSALSPAAEPAQSDTGQQSHLQSTGQRPTHTSADATGAQQTGSPNSGASSDPQGEPATTSPSTGIGGYIASVLGLSKSSSTDTRTTATQPQSTGESPATTIALSDGPLTISRLGTSGYEVDGQTISPGGVATAGGHTVLLQSQGAGLVIDNSMTTSIPTGAAPVLQYSQSGDAYIFGGETLAPGDVATVSGETFSLASSGVLVIDGTVTTKLVQSSVYVEGVVTLDGKVVTFDQIGTKVVIASQTLVPGEVVTVDGETLSLLPGQTEIVAVDATETSTMDLVATATETDSSDGTIGSTAYTAFSNIAAVSMKITLWPVVMAIFLCIAAV
jgi:hypothetical protein